VKVLVRSPEKLGDVQSKVQVIKGDVRNQENVDETVQGVDAVINALGNSYGDKTQSGDLCSVGTKNILQAMKKTGVNKIVTVSSMGVGDSWDDFPLLMKPVLHLFLGKALADKEIQEADIKASAFEWVIARPPRLVDGPKTGQWEAKTKWRPSQCSRADVADFCLKALGTSEYNGQALNVGTS
jgi:nucleoside-diphosphate-sugar epimerase